MNSQNNNELRAPIPLDLPQVPAAIDNGLIPIERLDAPLTINFPVWPAAIVGQTYELVFDGIRVPPQKPITEGDKPGDTLSVEVPLALLTEGIHKVSYRVYSENTDYENFSGTTAIQIDRTAPGAPQLAPIIFPDVIQNGLTSSELEGLNNVLPGKIAGYTGMAAGDEIRTYWGPMEGPMTVVDANDMGLTG